MAPPVCQRPTSSSGGGSPSFDTFPKRSSCGRTSTPIYGSSEVLAEISTPGARSPIHFVEETFYRGRPRSASSANLSSRSSSSSSEMGLLPPALCRQHSAPASSTSQSSSKAGASLSSSTAPGKHRRRASAPLDGVCLTLLGVSTGLKTPGVDTWEVANALLESSVDLRTRNVRGMTPLHLACSAGQVDVAKVLLLAGADSHARDHRSRCPLHMAASSGNSELVSSLLTCGADPNKASDLGTTALHNAALLGRVEVSRALLMAGADPNTTDHNSFSPLYLASQNGHTQLVLDLLAAGADAGLKTNRGFTPLHVAARCGRLAVLKALLDAGEAVDSLSSPVETTPLHLSAGFSRLACVQELLRRGADPSRRNKRGATPLDMVGTLIVPVGSARPYGGPSGSKGDGNAGLAREAFDNKLAQGGRVRAALAMAQRWQRRRGIVLAWETLRRRAAAASGASSEGGLGRGGLGERPSGRDAISKRSCVRHSRAGGPATAGCPAAAGQGWLLGQLCAHADPAVIKSVVRFL